MGGRKFRFCWQLEVIANLSVDFLCGAFVESSDAENIDLAKEADWYAFKIPKTRDITKQGINI